MPIRKDHRDLVLDALARRADVALESPGFRRSTRSLTYKRSLGESRQTLDMGYSSNPKYAPGAILHLNPQFRIALPRVSNLTCKMTGGAVSFQDPTSAIFGQPFQWYCEQAIGTMWLVASPAELDSAVSQILSVLNDRILPLLDELTTPGELIAVFEAGRALPRFQQHQFMHLVAAYEVEGQSSQARSALEKYFGSVGLRKRYAKAFEWHA